MELFWIFETPRTIPSKVKIQDTESPGLSRKNLVSSLIQNIMAHNRKFDYFSLRDMTIDILILTPTYVIPWEYILQFNRCAIIHLVKWVVLHTEVLKLKSIKWVSSFKKNFIVIVEGQKWTKAAAIRQNQLQLVDSLCRAFYTLYTNKILLQKNIHRYFYITAWNSKTKHDNSNKTFHSSVICTMAKTHHTMTLKAEIKRFLVTAMFLNKWFRWRHFYTRGIPCWGQANNSNEKFTYNTRYISMYQFYQLSAVNL